MSNELEPSPDWSPLGFIRENFPWSGVMPRFILRSISPEEGRRTSELIAKIVEESVSTAVTKKSFCWLAPSLDIHNLQTATYRDEVVFVYTLTVDVLTARTEA